MKINKLTFQNINSLKGLHVIEFNKPPLSETGIFAITGVVGSGKSTILDVITLALFNKTPRFTGGGGLNSSVISHHGAIITRNTKECFAEIEYEVKGNLYRSKWSVSKNRNDKLRDYEMEITHLNKDTLLDLKKREVPDKNAEIIGLNYEQFVKSIILSQGEFSKFLKAGESERSELLEKITGVDIYRKVGKACFDKNKEENEKLALLQAKSGIIEVLNDDELAELNKKITAFKETNKDIQNSEKQSVKLLSVKKNIIYFTEEKENIEKKLAINKQKIENFKHEQIKLDKHEKLSNFQNIFNNSKHIDNEINKSKNELSKLNKNLEKNSEEKKIVSKKNINIETKLKNLSAELIIKEPVFERVENLDKEIDLKIARNNDLNSQFTNETNLAEEKESEISIIEKKLSSLYIRYSEIDIFLKKSEKLKELPKELNSINEYIKSFQEYKNEYITAQKSSKINLVNKNILNSENIYNILQAEIKNTQNKITEIRTKTNYSENEIQEIQENIDKLRNKFKALDEIKTALKKIDLFKIQIKEINELIIYQKNETILFENNLTAKAKDKEILNKYIEELKVRLERQQLEKNYEKDRTNLKESEDCPLCGSKHHPFVKNYKNELSLTKKQLAEKEKNLVLALKSINDFEKEIIKSNSIISANDKSLEEKTILLESENKEIRRIIIDLGFSDITVNEIELKKEEIKNKGVNLANNLKSLLKLQELNLTKRNLDLLFEKAKIVFQTEQKIIGFKNKYANFINKNVSSEKLYLTLKELSGKYEIQQESRTKIANSTSENNEILKIKKQDLQQIKIAKNELSINLNKSKEVLRNLQNSRTEIFDNKNPKTEATKLNSQIKQTSEIHHQLTNELTALNTKINSIQSNLLSLNSELAISSKNKIELEDNLLKKLKNIDFHSIEDAKSAILTNKIAQKIKTEKQELNNDSVALNQSLKDKKDSIKQQAQEDDVDISLNELELQIADNKSISKNNTKEIGIISNKLSTDKENRKTVLKILQDIENQQKETEKWDSLSRIIGDAKGKKFTDYAQKLTLMQLFSLANKHLKSLDGRYLIDTNNTAKDIFVLDSYQGNLGRSVKTLSGGESFLVSLALALGLSDLAGRDTQINSLFIDEGFGSLDQQSLDTALSALEKLQSETNKTIGIISHVSSLKERIQTQISLKKSNSAYSELSIIG